MKKLNVNNYFSSLTDRGLSASKIKIFIKDPYFFYQKYIKKEIVETKNESFIIGSACDMWLTQSKRKFQNHYKKTERRNLKNPSTKFIELTEKQYDLVVDMCTKAEKHDAYKELKKHKSQVALIFKEKIGEYFDFRCGLIDWLKIERKKAIITDLKTSNTIDPRKYAFAAEEFGYFLSASMYCFLVEYNFPEVEEIEFRHLVIEKDTEGRHNVQTFILSQKNIELASQEMEMVIDEIRNIKEYKPRNISWKDAIKI